MSAALRGISGQGTERISGSAPGPAKVATRMVVFRRMPRRASLAPGGEGFLERLLAGRALLDRQDGATAVVVDDRNVEPGALFEELQVALHVAVRRRESDQEESRRDFDGEPGQRRSAGLLRLLHEDAPNV